MRKDRYSHEMMYPFDSITTRFVFGGAKGDRAYDLIAASDALSPPLGITLPHNYERKK